MDFSSNVFDWKILKNPSSLESPFFLYAYYVILSYLHGAPDVRPIGLDVGLTPSRILGLGTEALC